MGWGHFVGYLFGITFTSPLAYKAANLSALGFLAFISFVQYAPFPGSHWFAGFAGLSGFFGLIGVAFIIEMATRGRTRWSKPARPAVTRFRWMMGFAALAAILVSLLAMHVIELKELQQVQPAIPGPAEVAVEGLGLVPNRPQPMTMSDLKPTLSPAANADPRQSPRAAEMRAIVLAGLEYAIEHSEWPKTLDDLKINNNGSGHVDLGRYVYYPLNQESLGRNPQEVAVLAEKEPAFGGGRLVGFADGYIEFLRDPERLKRLFPSESKSPPASNEKKKEGFEQR
jgi:hypothetical protein